jgi:predicted nucleotidyltransferase
MRFFVRLTEEYVKVIKKHFNNIFIHGEIYLFGSRTDDCQKGGDIDLYLVLNSHENLFRKKIKFLSQVKKEIGEQKIDVIFNIDSNRLVEKEAIKWGIKL